MTAIAAPAPCVVGLFAHPDDEAYAAAGTLAACAEAGARVVVISVTRGEQGVDRLGRLAPGPRLGALRSEELAHSCMAIGAEPPRFLDLPDGGVRAAAGAKLLADHLDEVGADVVLTLGRDGAYGHPDHLAATAMVGRAAGSRRVLHAVFPLNLFEPLRRRLRGVTDLADVGLLGVEAGDVDLCVDLRGLRERKLASLAAHRSQLASDDPRSFLVFGLVDPLLDEEWFIHADGPPLPVGATSPLDGLWGEGR